MAKKNREHKVTTTSTVRVHNYDVDATRPKPSKSTIDAVKQMMGTKNVKRVEKASGGPLGT